VEAEDVLQGAVYVPLCFVQRHADCKNMPALQTMVDPLGSGPSPERSSTQL